MTGHPEEKALKVGFLGLGIMGVAMVRNTIACCELVELAHP